MNKLSVHIEMCGCYSMKKSCARLATLSANTLRAVAIGLLAFGLQYCFASHLMAERQRAEELSRALESGRVELIWQAFLNAPPILDNHHDSCGHFELHHLTLSNRKNRELRRFHVELGKDAAYFLAQDDGGLPLAVGRTGESYTLQDNGTWKRRELDLFFKFNATYFPRFVNIDRPDKQFRVLLDPGSVVKKLYEGKEVSLEWDRTKLMLEAKRIDGAKCEIRFRSPNDQLKYGSCLAEVSIYGVDNESAIRVASISRKESYLSNLNWEDLRAYRGIAADNDKAFNSELEYSLTNTDAKIRSSVEFWEIASGKGDIDLRGLELNEQSYEGLEERQKLTALILVSQNYLDSPNQVGAVSERLSSLLFDRGALTIDDPIIRWLSQEQRFGAATWLQAYLSCGRVIKDPRIFPKLKCELISLLGTSGRPPFELDGQIADDAFPNDPLAQAFIRVCWHLPCEERLIDVVSDVFRSYKESSPESFLAVEVMIRLDRLETVPQEALMEWYENHIADLSRTARSGHLALLTFTPSGQAFLVERLREKTDSTHVRREIARGLQARVVAVRELDRYDFISRERCEAIERAIAQDPELHAH